MPVVISTTCCLCNTVLNEISPLLQTLKSGTLSRLLLVMFRAVKEGRQYLVWVEALRQQSSKWRQLAQEVKNLAVTEWQT